MALSRDIVIRLLGDASSAVAAQRAAADAAEVSVAAYRRAEREFERQQRAADAAAAQQRRTMQEVGTATLGFGAAVTAGLGMTVKAAMDWESAWAGVTKTVSGTPAQLREVETGLRNLARTLPATHGEIAAVAEAAGQLGVETDSVVEFTRTMVNLGETTNLSADEAATSLAQLMNVMRTAPEDVDNLGAALVALGNDGASTEADIMKMASYLSGAGALIGASESDVLALSNTLTSMGVNAERGGGVMTRVMQDVYAAVQTGGAKLDGFAKTAGMSAAEFARAFEADPIRAIGAFTDGLGAAKDRGENVIEMMGDLGYKGTQDTAVLLQLASAQGDLNKNLDLGAEAWRANTALVEEAAKRYDTTAAKLEIARNGINDAAIEIGQTFLPVLADMAGGLADVAGWFADLPDPIQSALGVLAGIAGVGALVGGAFLLMAPRVMETVSAFRALRASGGRAATAMGNVGKAAGVATALVVLGAAVRGLDEAMAPASGTMEQYTAALLDMDGTVESIDARFGSLDKNLTTDIDGFSDALKRLTDPSNGERLNDFGGALFNVVTFGGAGTGEGAASRRRVLEEFQGLDQALRLMVESGNTEMAAAQFKVMADEARANGVSIAELKEIFPEYQGALKGIENDQTLAAESARVQGEQTALLAQDLDAAYGSIEGYAASMGLSEEATDDLIKKTQELGESLADFINPLGVYTGMLDEKAAAEEEAARKAAESAGASAESWRDFVVDTGFSFDEYMGRLREQVEAQENWQVNMLTLAGRVSQGTLDELARMGPEGAPYVAELVTRSDEELSELDDMFQRRSKDATDAWGAQFTMATPVLAQIGKTAGAGVVAELAAQLQAGTITVAQIAAQYGLTLAGGINPVLGALGRPKVTIQAPGGPNRNTTGFFAADGALVEQHDAQMSPAGAWRVWAEPETGGESYIPHAAAKRDRSLNIWRETGKILNAPEAQYFANGGFVTAADVPRPSSTAPYQMPISTAGDATMQKGFDEVTAWLTANAEGIAGSGAVGGAWGSLWQLVKSQIPQARINSTYRAGDPGYHGRGKAIDFGFGSGPGGAGSAGLASINRLLHDQVGSNLAELIYDGIGDDRPDLKNGKPLTYSAATRAQHTNHVHGAVYDQGGWLKPGYTLAYNGTGRPEKVSTYEQTRGLAVGAGIPVGSATAGGSGIDYARLAAAIGNLSGKRTHITVDATGYNADVIADRAVRRLRQEEFLSG